MVLSLLFRDSGFIFDSGLKFVRYILHTRYTAVLVYTGIYGTRFRAYQYLTIYILYCVVTIVKRPLVDHVTDHVINPYNGTSPYRIGLDLFSPL